MKNKYLSVGEMSQIFKDEYLPNLLHKDVTAILTAYNDFMDMLHKSGQISCTVG